MERFTGIRIGVDRISNHPDNPRKDLGDLSELVASIKDHGILQNITVMPRACMDTPKEEQTAADPEAGSFVVLLGHRRLAAYRIANGGWSDIVCNVVWGLSRSEQIGLMMEENAQRNDLTVPEQIESFQLMLDLGESVDSISEKTGFSKSTIYKRVKNADVVEAIKDCSYQLTIADLDELAKVGKEDKERILKKATTPQSIRQGVDEAIRLEKRTKNIDLIRQQLLDKGLTECVDKNECGWWGMSYVTSINMTKDISGEIEALTGDEFFEMPRPEQSWIDMISIKRPKGDGEEEDEEEETEEERERREKEEDAWERIRKNKETVKTGINDFIKRIILEYGAENIPDADLIDMLAEEDIDISVNAPVAIVNDKRIWAVDDEERKDFYSKNKASFKTMAIASLWEDKTWIGAGGRYDYGDVEKVMELIEKEGYIRPSEECMEVIKGTSELFDIVEGKE